MYSPAMTSYRVWPADQDEGSAVHRDADTPGDAARIQAASEPGRRLHYVVADHDGNSWDVEVRRCTDADSRVRP